MRLSDFDYELPVGLIAQHPLPRRDDSRMMVVDHASGRIRHGAFKDVGRFLGAGDVLVLNDARVIPAKAWGTIAGKDVEFLFLKESAPGVWDVLCKPAGRVKPGGRVRFGPGFEADVVGRGEEGRRSLRFAVNDVLAGLREIGYAPLPPYIKRKRSDLEDRPRDLERYQTVFAARESAIAAPTAGLHFTRAALAAIKAEGVEVVPVTLEVGLATFQPVRVEDLDEHAMLEERYEISAAAAAAINAAKRGGRPVLAVGTTVVRALESAALAAQGRARGQASGPQRNIPPAVVPGAASSSLFIKPGFAFRVVDRLLTNFHLPQSTLLVLVSAFAGRELVLAAYREAVRERYRFFSYGDVMLIV